MQPLCEFGTDALELAKVVGSRPRTVELPVDRRAEHFAGDVACWRPRPRRQSAALRQALDAAMCGRIGALSVS